MISKYYLPTGKKVWQGRIDDTEDFDAFRWHQWVHALDLENLDAIKLNEDDFNICFLGFCCDQGVTRNKGRNGASKGPNAIRKEMANLPCHFSNELKLFDAGNLITQNIPLEEAQDILSILVDKILSLGMFPIVLGGGHEIAFGHYNGIRKNLNSDDKKLGIINFDAHFDIRPYPNGGSSGTMFRQIYDQSQVDDFHYGYMAIGIQKRSNTVALFKSAQEMNIQYMMAKHMVDKDVSQLLSSINRFVNNHDHIYMTICSDVFSSAFAPGVSAAQVLGLHPEQVIKIIKFIFNSGKVISFDIAEVSPRFDHDNTTANLAATIIFAIVNTLAGLNDLDKSIF